MTICIAAICDKGDKIVVAADKMFTAGMLNLEFEPPLSKIEQLSPRCVAMAAGSSLSAAEIVETTRNQVLRDGTADTQKTALIAKDAYANLRNAKIEEQILTANLGPDFTLFRSKGVSLPAYLQPQPALYQQIVIQTSQFNLGVDILIAGCDDKSSHIWHLGHPGSLTVFDKLGYNAIGSGGVHAMQTLHLGEQSPSSSLAATLHAVLDAKLNSEVAPGVGQETELAVLTKDGFWVCPHSFIEGLTKVRDESIQESKPDLETVQRLYDEHRDSI